MRWIRTGQGAALAILIALAAVLLADVVLSSRPVGGAAVPVLPLATASPTADALTVVGAGSSAATPDQAYVGLGVSADRGTVADAFSAAGADMTRLIASLHDQGVVDRDIQTSGLSASQNANCCPRTVTGYNSSGSVTVLVHHLANVAALISAAVAAVGNDIQLNGVSLSVSDNSAAVKSARSAAMSDANARANNWAALAGRRLGGIISVSEPVPAAQIGGCGGGCGGAGGAGGGFPIMAGQSQLTLSVTVVYELLP